jgi:magnesium-protoporphyrin O-methyltransferase
MVFTHAPSTVMLEIMHAAGSLFPRGDKAPAIQPVSGGRLARLMDAEDELSSWKRGRVSRVNCGFYISEARELRRT